MATKSCSFACGLENKTKKSFLFAFAFNVLLQKTYHCFNQIRIVEAVLHLASCKQRLMSNHALEDGIDVTLKTNCKFDSFVARDLLVSGLTLTDLYGI